MFESEFKEVLDNLSDFKKTITQFQNKVRMLEKKVQRYEVTSNKKRKKQNKEKQSKGICKPVLISDELCSFIGKEKGTQMARTEVTKYLIQYIKENKLQQDDNKRIIQPDDNLKNLLKIENNEEVNFFNIQKFMNPHYLSPDLTNVVISEN